MNKRIHFLLGLSAVICMAVTCKKQASENPVVPPADTSLVNMAHLDYLFVPITFPGGIPAAGVFIYANAPDYHLTPAAGEGYTCVDDVSRAALVYLRNPRFSADTILQSKAFRLIRFLLQMQSSNGYFYNFLSTGTEINTSGTTSINQAGWWSWRALQTLAEGAPVVRSLNPVLSGMMDQAVHQLIAVIKRDLVPVARTTTVVSGITIPQWLPAGSGTDQAALLILGLIDYCTVSNDAVIHDYIQKLADGILLMQHGDETHFPYGAFLSWENTWHAYGNEQAYALFKASGFLNDPRYQAAALSEVDHFYPWLLQNGLKSSFTVVSDASGDQMSGGQNYDQIAYGIKPMVFASAEAYRITGDEKYADIAGHLAAWFFGANDAGKNMYSVTTGRCYDGLSSPTSVNLNSGAESTIEALLTMQRIESYPKVKSALNTYKK